MATNTPQNTELEILLELRKRYGSIFMKDNDGNPTFEVTVEIADFIETHIAQARREGAEEMKKKFTKEFQGKLTNRQELYYSYFEWYKEINGEYPTYRNAGHYFGISPSSVFHTLAKGRKHAEDYSLKNMKVVIDETMPEGTWKLVDPITGQEVHSSSLS